MGKATAHMVSQGWTKIPGSGWTQKPKPNNQSSNNTTNADLEAVREAIAASARAHAAELKRLEEEREKARLAEEEKARNRAIEAESARARNMQLGNEADINQRLGITLNSPMQVASSSIQPQYTASGFTAGPSNQAASTGGGRAAAQTSASINPTGAIIAKINEDSGGGTGPSNRFQMPNLTGITFGGA